MPSPKVLLVADWLTDRGGAEVVFEQLCDMFPEADIAASVCFMEGDFLKWRKIITSWIQHLPSWIARKHQLCALLRPFAFRSIDVRGYDLIISSASAEAKAIGMKYRVMNWRWHIGNDTQNTSPSVWVGAQRHICYCHTPIRYYWSHYDEYVSRPGFHPILRFGLRLVLKPLRALDLASVGNVDVFIANSRTTQERIQQYYGRESSVIYPGIDLWDIPTPQEGTLRENYIAVGRVVPYKRFDLIVDAFNISGKSLTIISESRGSLVDELKARSKQNIAWKSWVSNSDKYALISRSRALIFPQLEDFGIVPIEAQACGTPVIAFRWGGALETVLENISWVFFDEQTVSSLNEWIERFEARSFDEDIIIAHAKGFWKESFTQKIHRCLFQSL